MGDILGADFLTNPRITESSAVDIRMADIGAVELPSFNLNIQEDSAPKIIPSLSSVGEMRTSDGFENLNAEPFIGMSQPVPRRMSEEHLLKEKYELLRKFDRLAKLGVPMRKRFTLESPIDEMKMELDFIKREKDADATIKQFCDWYVTGMSAMEWSSKNVPVMKAFGLNLEGLSESAQMNVADMEEDFEELYDLYGDKLKMHPLVRIPIRTCMMVYMVHLTNQMAQKSPIPNMDQILRTNPDIARQLATATMQQQTQSFRQAPATVSAPPSSNPLAGLAGYMNSMMPPPPPQQTNVRPPPPTSIKSPVRIQKPNPQPPAARVNIAPAPAPMPAREMKGPSMNIDELLKSVNANIETKSVTMRPPTPRRGPGSTGKNSVTIKL
jgi:hypothetical protein